MRLRGIRNARGIPITKLVLAGCQRWIDENLWKIDEHGVALFGSDFDPSLFDAAIYPSPSPREHGFDTDDWAVAPAAAAARLFDRLHAEMKVDTARQLAQRSSPFAD